MTRIVQSLNAIRESIVEVGRRASSPRILIYTSIALVIITFIGYLGGFWQTKKQLDITRQNLELIGRPFVALTNHGFWVEKRHSITPGEYLLAISFLKNNFGEKPARSVITKNYYGFVLYTSTEERDKVIKTLEKEGVAPHEKEKAKVEYGKVKRKLIEEVATFLDKNKAVDRYGEITK